MKQDEKREILGDFWRAIEDCRLRSVTTKDKGPHTLTDGTTQMFVTGQSGNCYVVRVEETDNPPDIIGGTCGNLTWWCGGIGGAGAGYMIRENLTVCASCYRLAPFQNGCRWVTVDELRREEAGQYEEEKADAPSTP